MEQVVIVDAIRTPMGRSKGGAFRNVPGEDLSARLMRSLLARNPSLTAATLDDIYWGAHYSKRWSKALTLPVTPRCFGRNSHSVPAVTVNRLCGFDAGVTRCSANDHDRRCAGFCLVSGVEHMGHVPMSHGVDFHRV